MFATKKRAADEAWKGIFEEGCDSEHGDP